MKNIKVIKKKAASKLADINKTFEENKPLSESKGGSVIKTVETWVAEWRNRNDTETRCAFDKLINFNFRNSG